MSEKKPPLVSKDVADQVLSNYDNADFESRWTKLEKENPELTKMILLLAHKLAGKEVKQKELMTTVALVLYDAISQQHAVDTLESIYQNS